MVCLTTRGIEGSQWAMINSVTSLLFLNCLFNGSLVLIGCVCAFPEVGLENKQPIVDLILPVVSCSLPSKYPNIFAQLRQVMKIRSFLSSADLEKVIHAFLSSRLDYCNTLYSGISRRNIQRLQLIQNAAARFLTCTKRHDHITPILAALHWSPVSFRIDFKILLLVFKALNAHGK